MYCDFMFKFKILIIIINQEFSKIHLHYLITNIYSHGHV